MNKDDILRLAREAGDKGRVDPLTPDGEWVILTPDELVRFADLVAEAEREEATARRIELQEQIRDLQERLNRADMEKALAVAQERERIIKP